MPKARAFRTVEAKSVWRECECVQVCVHLGLKTDSADHCIYLGA